MKNYKTINNEVHSFEDNVTEDFLNKKIKELGLMETTEVEITEINNQKDLEYNIKNHIAEKTELYTLQKYLDDTDYMAIKCTELEVKMSVKYPEDFIKRQEARDRINELHSKLALLG